MSPPRPALLLALCLSGQVACGLAVNAHAFYDTNGNQRRDADEPGAPQVMVSDGDRLWRTDADGRVRCDLQREADEVVRLFVILPSGHRATTPWQVRLDLTAAGEPEVWFGLQPVRDGDRSFVVTAETQITAATVSAVAGRFLEELCPAAEPPAFVAHLGDATANGTASELGAWREAVAGAAAPVYAVFGAHDGASTEPPSITAFEQELGPAWYAFWSGGRCFLVLATEPGILTGQQQARQLRWLQRLLMLLPEGCETVVLSHVPPAFAELAAIRARTKLRAVFYAHWHENSLWWLATTPMICTGPFQGVEWGAGTGSFRRVRLTDEGLEAPVGTLGVRRLLQLLSPTPLAPPGRLDWSLQALAYDSREDVTRVEARLDGGRPLPLRRVGRLMWRLDLPPLDGAQLKLTAQSRSGAVWEQVAAVPPAQPAPRVDTTAGEPRPPLVRAWLASTGVASLTAAPPVISGGRVWCGLADDDVPNRSAVLCLDAATGSELWRTPTHGAVRAQVEVAGGRVYALTCLNEVYCLDADRGGEVWRRELTPEPPGRHRSGRTGLTVWRDRVFAQVAGGALVALRATNGETVGEIDVPLAVAGAPVVEGHEVLVATVDGLLGLDALTLAVRWQTPATVALPRSGPLTVAGHLALVAGDELWAVDIQHGTVRWHQPLPFTGLALGGVTVVGGRLITPGARPVAWYVGNGEAAWPGLRPSPGAAQSASAVAGNHVWTAGDDGHLNCYALADGQLEWQTSLGCPVKAGPVIAGGLLVVVDAAGNVHGLVSRG